MQYVLAQGAFFDILFPGADARLTTKPYEVFNDFTARTDRDLLLLNGRLVWSLADDLTVRSTTGYVQSKYKSRFDGDGTALAYISVGTALTGARRGDSRTASQKLTLSGKLSALEFVAGVFCFHVRFDPYVVFEFW